jgi:hypothetical protein
MYSRSRLRPAIGEPPGSSAAIHLSSTLTSRSCQDRKKVLTYCSLSIVARCLRRAAGENQLGRLYCIEASTESSN